LFFFFFVSSLFVKRMNQLKYLGFPSFLISFFHSLHCINLQFHEKSDFCYYLFYFFKRKILKGNADVVWLFTPEGHPHHASR
jgi:hypothetical protein